jgi:hypothetical protein
MVILGAQKVVSLSIQTVGRIAKQFQLRTVVVLLYLTVDKLLMNRYLHVCLIIIVWFALSCLSQ